MPATVCWVTVAATTVGKLGNGLHRLSRMWKLTLRGCPLCGLWIGFALIRSRRGKTPSEARSPWLELLRQERVVLRVKTALSVRSANTVARSTRSWVFPIALTSHVWRYAT